MNVETIDTAHERRRLLADGFVVIPGVIAPEALARLRDRVALFYRAWERYPESTRKEHTTPSPDNYLPVREINWPAPMLHLLDDEPAMTAVRRVVDSLAEGACRLIHVNSLLKPAGRGAPIEPHQDTAYNIQPLQRPLTVWIPFEEVNQDSGAVYYLPGSHRLGELDHYSSGKTRWVTKEQLSGHNRPARRTYDGDPGSIGVHDSRLVHGSHANRSRRDRLALSLRFELADGSTEGRAPDLPPTTGIAK